MAEVPEGAIVITPQMMYETLSQVVKKVDHIETLLNPVLNNIKQEVSDNKKETDKVTLDHETRLRLVEKRVWMALGGSVLLSTVASIVVVWLKK